MSWTDERVADLRKLHLDGLSAEHIARKLGGVTRNAVIGKLARLGLGRSEAARVVAATVKRRAAGGGSTGARKSPPVTIGVAGNGMVFDRGQARPPAEPMPPTPPPAPASLKLRMIDPGFGGCRWPISDPGPGRGEEMRFCCAPRPEGAIYCAHHAEISRPKVAASQKKPKTASELARSLRKFA
jgi:GcrA cell cycle regulator